jgi:hypothetical protein
MEIHDQLEAAPAQLRGEAPPRARERAEARAPQRRAQLVAREHEHLVEPGLPAQQARGCRLHEPGQLRARIRCAQRARGGQRSHDVAESPEADHQDPVRLGRARKGVQTAYDRRPRVPRGGW